MKNTPLAFTIFVLMIFAASCKKGQSPGHGKPPFYDTLKHGLLVYYPFDGNTTDGSGNNINGTGQDITPTADRFGKANSAYYFNGTSSYIVIDDISALRLNNTNFTLNGWVKLDSYTSPNIFTKRFTPGPNTGWQWSVTNDRPSSVDPVGLLSYGPGGGSINAFGKTVVSLNKWHLMTTTYNLASKTLTIYVDAIFDSATVGVLSPNPSITTKLYIGRDDLSNLSSTASFKGAMDDMRIYTRELSTKEIIALYYGAK